MSIFQVFTADTSTKSDKIVLREEQVKAIKDAKTAFDKKTTDKKPYLKYLWNAKMRFGKTLCALQLAKDMEVKRVLIVTHRPVVNASWKEDFKKIFSDVKAQYQYGTKFGEAADEGNFEELERFVSGEGNTNHYVFFVSMQYLRLSAVVKPGGDHDPLKKKILDNNWDLVVVDEAHEGTRTSLGERVIQKLCKYGTRMLHLSGTPFNLYDDFEDDEIYTWDYIKEQKAKRDWTDQYPLAPNPYLDLPAMKVFTYDLGKLIKGKGLVGENAEFKFSEFFRTWTGNLRSDGAVMPEGAKGRFVHEDAVKSFIDLLCTKNEVSNYPFSTDEYRKAFKHTLWVVPGVREAAALKTLLEAHRIFKRFKVVNVAGNSDDDETRADALDKVEKAIGAAPEQTNTITISCGRLTTGTTVRPWTAVFYLKGSEMTSAATYMQTIFRVQTPYHTADGRMKAECYVFDFAPDRSLKMMAETAKFSNLKQKEKRGVKSAVDDEDLAKMKEFLDFCPVISLDGGKMVQFDEHKLFAQLQNVLIDRIARNGFNDNALYNSDYLMNLDDAAVTKLNALRDIISKTTNMTKPPTAKNATQMAQNGLTGKEKETAKEAKKKEREGKPLTQEEKEVLRKLQEQKKEERKQRDDRIAILRGISLRIPLMIFGAKLEDEKTGITIDNFTQLVDDASWEEFMPRGVTKEKFNDFKKCYDPVKFAEAGKRYREWARLADSQTTDERIKTITTIHSYFHNPDKETVLTPWRVVNMHLSSTLGGYCFFNEAFDGPNLDDDGEETTKPRWVEQPEISEAIFRQADPRSGKSPVRILEINSKTGLYPLYMAYSLYRSIRSVWLTACTDPKHQDAKEGSALWDQILQENIFVICNTPMAARITERTLRGFRDVSGMHIRNIKLIEEATQDREKLVKKLNSEQFWFANKGSQEMKFSAIVGNPPYQEMATGAASGSDPLYHKFIDVGMSICEKGTLIHPGRFLFRAGKTPREWNEKILSDKHIKVTNYYPNSRDIFPSVDIKGGIAVTFWDKKQNFNPIGVFVVHAWLSSILSKVKTNTFKSFMELVYSRTVYRLSETLYMENPWAEGRQSKGHRLDLGSNIFSVFPELFTDEIQSVNNAKIYGLENSKRVFKNVKRDYLNPPDNFDYYKVMVPKSNGSGAIGEVLSTPLVGLPLVGHTETFLSIGKFKTLAEAEACLKYVKSKFARVMLGTLKVTQDNTRETWANVPLQDFTEKSDIDWTKSVENIDQQLYKKYSLSTEEIEQIEKNVQSME